MGFRRMREREEGRAWEEEKSRNEEEVVEEEGEVVRMQRRQTGAQVSDASNNIFMPCS